MTGEHRGIRIPRLIPSPEKSYNLPVYVEIMAAQYEQHGCRDPKPSKPKYASNVVQFLELSASEDEESASSSSSEVSMTI